MPARCPGVRDQTPRAAVAGFLAGRDLSAAHRRIAEALVADLPDSVFLSADRLADRAGVSQPSVTRFAQALGFAGYSLLQEHLRTLILAPRGRIGAPANAYQAAVREAIENLEALESSLADTAGLRALARQITRSVPLVVLSVRVAAPVATYFSYFAARIHPDIRSISGGGSTALDGLNQARQSGAEWVVCFLLPRYPKEVVDALDYARHIGLRVVTVTDRVTGPISELSDVVVPTGIGSQLTFGTIAAPMVYASILLQAMADVVPRRTQARLDEYERMVAGQQVFYGAPRRGADAAPRASLRHD